jgi:hypothetical protein
MPSFGSLVGKWMGGLHGSVVRVEFCADGVTRGEWAGKTKESSGGGFEGKMLNKEKFLRGFWYDADSGVTVGNRFQCTCVVSLDEQADPAGNTMLCTYKTKDGGEASWTATRHSETGKVPRVDRKIASFSFRNKAVFEKLTKFDVGERAAETEKRREEALASEPVMNLDGASMYVPPPGVGAEYLNSTDLERAMRRIGDEKTEAYRARLAKDLEAIKAIATDGEKLKKRYNMDADIAKRFIEIYEKLIKGETQYDLLMTDRHAFVPSMGPPQLESSKFAEHMGDPYFSDVELQREIARRDKKFMGAFGERVSAQMAWLEKHKEDAEALKKRSMEPDIAKRKLEIYAKLVAGEKKMAALAERPSFKPNDKSWEPDSYKPAEHLHTKYFSAVELDRELARRDKKHWEEYTEKITKEVEYLKKIKDDGEKLKKWVLDADAAGKRIETLGRIIVGQGKEKALAERPAVKPSMPTSVTRLSGTVMLHPLNIRKALRGGQ